MDKRERIFDAVLKIAMTGGLSATPMAKIAQEAGIAAGTIYRYFESKDVLLATLYNEIADELNVAITQQHKDDLPLKPMLFSMWHAVLAFHLDFPCKVRFMQEYQSTHISCPEVQAKQQVVYRLLTEVLHRGMAEKTILPLPCQTLSAYILGPITELSRHHQRGVMPLTPPIVQEAFDVLWRGIQLNPIMEAYNESNH